MKMRVFDSLGIAGRRHWRLVMIWRGGMKRRLMGAAAAGVLAAMVCPVRADRAVTVGSLENALEASAQPMRAGVSEPREVNKESIAESATGQGKPFWEWDRATDNWGGVRSKMEEGGLSLNGAITALFAKSLRGGQSTRMWAASAVFDANLTLDLGKVMKLEGGTLFLDFQQQTTGPQSPDGALMPTSNVNLPERTQLSQAWYEQKFGGEKFRLKIGKVDANSDFSAIDTSAEFLNNAMPYAATNFGFPTFPDSAVGVALFAYPTENLYAGVGLYDGETVTGISSGNHAPRIWTNASNLYLIGEVGGTWDAGAGRKGKLGLGVWHICGDVTRLDGSTASGATGPYGFVEQVLWRAAPESDEDQRGISAYGLYGYADPGVSVIEHHVAGGLTWRGALPSRDKDLLGVGMTWGDLGHGGFSRGHEWAVESFYQVQVTPWFLVKPDLQYVHNPGGGGMRDAVVLTVQMVLNF